MMHSLFSAIKQRLTAGESAVFCRVIAKDGSTPRGPGAAMAVFADGSTIGTIGGGAVEYTSTQYAKRLLHGETAVLHAFRLTPNEIEDIGMVCGGDVTVFFQPLTKEDLPLVEEILTAAGNKATPSYLKTTYDQDGKVAMEILYGNSDPLCRPYPHLVRGEPLLYIEPLVKLTRAVIFGGGHVGLALAPVLSALDFRVVVYDDRPHAATKENFPTAEKVILANYDDISPHITLLPTDYAIVMTSGHQGDYTLLRQLLRTDVTYIGCIGSRRKVAVTRERLLSDGFTEEEIARIHSPIGLPIGAETPQEIAISIAAEIIAHRANQQC